MSAQQTLRLACVQNGNYALAVRELAAGGAETYGGQRYTLEAFRKLVGDQPHLVVSLTASPYREQKGNALFAGVCPPPGRSFLPGRITERWRAARVIRELEAFRPNRLLLRCNDLVGCELLRWSRRRGVETAVIIASRFDIEHPPCLRFCELANDDNVLFVANHNRVATQSMIDCGLRPEKAVMWDYPPALTPQQYQPKTLAPGSETSLLFAGTVSEEKGVTDIVKGCEIARRNGRGVGLTICGDGPARAGLQAHPGVSEGWIHLAGRIGHDEVVRRMRESQFVIVPSRHEYPEALPCVIQEALAVRTPLILSDHPIFLNYFRDGQAVRFFKAATPQSLAEVIADMSDHPADYARLSEQTAEVWQSFQIETRFHHLLERLAARWEPRRLAGERVECRSRASS